jgi:hypothetical protein
VILGGSLSEGRGDPYSDIDLAVFIRDADLPSFEQEWKAWAAGLGRLLLAYVGGVGHPWAVYDAAPLPLRVDFSLWPASRLDVVSEWPVSPTSVGSAVLYDATEGRLSALVQPLVGQSLAPVDLERAFEAACGDFWYYLVRILGKLERGDVWGAYWELQVILVGNLLGILRIDAGLVGRWRAAGPAQLASRDLSSEGLTKLAAALPSAVREREVRRSLADLAGLARRACASIAERERWLWPAELSERVAALLPEESPARTAVDGSS